MLRPLLALSGIYIACMATAIHSADVADRTSLAAGSTSEAAAHLIVSPPLPELLARGVVYVPFSTDNLKVLPVYGAAARSVVPRIGHLHVTIDQESWHWVHSSAEPIIIQGLAAGPHKLRIDLADANHAVIESQTVSFEIPARSATGPVSGSKQ
jgi:hypothetical protein